MNCAHRRHAGWSTARPNCPRCGGRAAAVAAAVVGLLAIGTVGVPASAARAAAVQDALVRLPAGLVGPVANAGGAAAAANRARPAARAAQGAAASRSAAVTSRPPVLPAAAPAAPAPSGWTGPVPGAPVSEPFGLPDSGYAAGYHTGTDFAADQGTPALAVGPGTVASAGWQESYGNAVSLLLPDGRYAFYAHLSAIDVSAGQWVPGGLRLGLVGSTGNSTGPHLHFEIRTSDSYGAVVDPVAYLRAHGVTGY